MREKRKVISNRRPERKSEEEREFQPLTKSLNIFGVTLSKESKITE